MNNLYAPWRDDYIHENENEKVECPFCDIYNNKDNDKKNNVLYRAKNCFVVMNKYPYTAGHFMIIPNKHIDNIENLDENIWLEISSYVQKSVRVLKKFGAHGVNIGMNLGECAGAGIAKHVHYHLVPRFKNDSNFITTIGNNRIYSTSFDGVYEKIKTLILEEF